MYTYADVVIAYLSPVSLAFTHSKRVLDVINDPNEPRIGYAHFVRDRMHNVIHYTNSFMKYEKLSTRIYLDNIFKMQNDKPIPHQVLYYYMLAQLVEWHRSADNKNGYFSNGIALLNWPQAVMYAAIFNSKPSLLRSMEAYNKVKSVDLNFLKQNVRESRYNRVLQIINWNIPGRFSVRDAQLRYNTICAHRDSGVLGNDFLWTQCDLENKILGGGPSFLDSFVESFKR